jgi:pyruvate decarboxylase
MQTNLYDKVRYIRTILKLQNERYHNLQIHPLNFITMSYTQQNSLPLGAYILERLKQLGIVSIFGVPGDYNLQLLDFIEPAGLHWVGNCNELNAAYAADAYSRIHGLGAVITTFGVGELSAINGIAGAYAERAPVIHIVGAPSRNIQSSRTLVHHTFIDGDYQRFASMYAHVTAAQISLTDARTAPDKVDWVIEQAIIQQRPVYLQIPEDMANVPVSAVNLSSRPIISLPVPTQIDMNLVDSILDNLYAAKRPLIFVDGETRNLGAIGEINQLVSLTGWPTWTSPFGKGLVNEELPNVHGVYLAKYGDKSSLEYFKTSDLVVFLGPHLSDINTHIFTAIPEESRTISFSQDQIKIYGKTLRDISARNTIQKLLERIDPSRLVEVDDPNILVRPTPTPPPSEVLCQDLFYPYINPMFRRGDIVLTETGTAAEGGQVFKLPQDCRFYTAVTWLSIGYMLPATLGAALAQRDRAREEGNTGGRAILFIGDGSFQMTAQELSTIIRENLNVIIILINNNGYTIERVIHGRHASYNGISQWNHQHALGLFGLSQDECSKRYFSARTWGELKKALDSQSVQQDDGVRLIEVFMGQEDCTGELKDLLAEQIAMENKCN